MISLDQFMEIFRAAEIEQNTHVANEALFRMYDRQGKGYIDAEDLRRVARLSGVELGEEEIESMLGFNLVPGQAQFDEFAEIMNDQSTWF